MQRRAERRSGGTWLLQALTGLLVILLLGLHMIAQHFIAAGGLRDYQEVLAYIRTPIILVLELLFLFVVTYHALLGIRAVVADLNLGKGLTDGINTVLTGLGVVAVLYGCFLTYVLLTKA